MVGYVHSDYIKVIGEAVDDTVTGNMDLFSKGTVKNRVGRSMINVIDRSSVNGNILGRLNVGDQVSVTAITENGTWYKISTPLGGYVTVGDIRLAESGVHPMEGQVKYIYGILTREEISDKWKQFEEEADKGNGLYLTLMQTLYLS